MNKLLAFILTVFSRAAMACPYCAGSPEARDKYTIVILAIFIALTYIPFALLFSFIKKYSPKKQIQDESGRSS